VDHLARALAAALGPVPPAHPRPRGGSDALRPAAVLVPLLVDARSAAPELLFIVRPERMARHAGQVAFPGGRTDPEDPTPTATALRETWEELGVPVDQPRVVGGLPPLPTPSGYLVTPIVALLPRATPLTPAPDEVARHFTVPVSTLLGARGRRTMLANRRSAPGTPPVPLHFWVETPEVIWGVTGHILDALLSRAGPLLAPGA
jgi:8-oxo-dGTP pyrophosphatase MutT (NUDIX family)